MTLQPVKADEVTDLIIEEVDLLDFKIPTYDEVLSAYSDGYVEEMANTYTGPERRKKVEQDPGFEGDRRAYPPNPRFSKPKIEDPGYSIDEEDDPLPI